MFGKGESKKDNISTVFGQDCMVKGIIETCGLTRLDGTLEGELIVKGNLLVGETAKVKGNITGESVVIAGQVTGDVTAHESLELAGTAKLRGNIKTITLRIAPGAVFVGSSLVLDQGVQEAAAASSLGTDAL